MPLEAVRASVRFLRSAGLIGPELTVVWHAGEPLVMPIDFYREAIEICAAEAGGDSRVTHSFQTNGTLLSGSWADFFRDPRIRVGLSIDGPAFLHDANRITRSGKPTHSSAMRAVNLLNKHGIEFHVICVLTRKSLLYADEIFDWAVQNKIRHIGFNIEELEGANLTSSLSEEQDATRLSRFMRRLAHLVSVEAGPQINVREFGPALSYLRLSRDTQLTQSGRAQKTPLRTGNQENTPFRIVTVLHDGRISTFSPELAGSPSQAHNNFIFGNVLNDTWESIHSNPVLHLTRSQIEAGVDNCRRRCAIFDFCGGGSPSNKFAENGTLASSETMHCRLHKKTLLESLSSGN